MSVDERTESEAVFPAAQRSGRTGTRVNADRTAARLCPGSDGALKCGTRSA